MLLRSRRVDTEVIVMGLTRVRRIDDVEIKKIVSSEEREQLRYLYAM